jgi:hypothetical protein
MRSSPRVLYGVSTLLAALTTLGACGGDDDAGVDAGPDLPPAWTDPDPEGSETLLGYDATPAFDLILTDEAIATLEADPRTYVPGDIVVEGETYGPVGVRLKGQNSFQPITEKPSFRINVNEYYPDASIYGLKDFTFNNMSSDTSMMHERLAYKVARDAGVPASRCNHATVSINGELRGLYANVETVKKRMLGSWFDDNDGSLYSVTDVDFVAGDVGEAGFELKEGDDDRSVITALTEALELADPDDAMAAAAEHIDLDNFLSFWAVEALIAQFDAMPYSNPGDDYFIYIEPTSQKIHFMPWGMDETWLSAEYPVAGNPVLERPLGILATRCKESPACYQAFADRLWELLAMIEDDDLEAERDRVIDQIAPHVADDAYKPYAADEVDEGQMQLYYFIHGRRETLEDPMNNPDLPPPS